MKPLIYETIYSKLEKAGILKITEHRKIDNPPYMALSVDILEDNEKHMRIAMAHNYIQNGDVMADPDMEIKVHKELKMAEALTYQQDGLGIFQQVYPEPGKVNPVLKTQLNQFLNQWLTNLKNQGFFNKGA